MDTYNEIIEKLMCLYNKVNENYKTPREYGTGHILYQAEIHAIRAIKNHSQANASELAKILGITNGAVTQVIGKLIAKGLANKYCMDNNKKEVYFTLTEYGETVFKAHEKYNEELQSKVAEYLTELDDEKIKFINEFLDRFYEISY